MSRSGDGDGGGLGARGRFAAAQADLEVRAQADLKRAMTLAAELKAVLGSQPPNADELAQLLSEAQRLVPEARDALGRHLAFEQLSPQGPIEALDSPNLVQALVDTACPPGSGRRQSLGAAILRRSGMYPGGHGPKTLELAVSRALQALAPRVRGAAPPPLPQDRLAHGEPKPGAVITPTPEPEAMTPPSGGNDQALEVGEAGARPSSARQKRSWLVAVWSLALDRIKRTQGKRTQV